MARTLDVPEVQVLVDFFGDADGLFWHHRLLLQQGPDSRWIWATPDLDVQHGLLSRHRVVPLRRNMEFPADKVAETYAFDPDISDGDLARLRADALALAKVLGFPVTATPGGVAAGGDSRWRMSDPAREDFGEAVPDEAMADAASVRVEGNAALVLVDGEWAHASRVEESKKAEWLREKRAGPGRDLRLLADERDGQGRRFMPFARAMELSRVDPSSGLSASSGGIFEGPMAAHEFLGNINQMGLTLLTHDAAWRARSGVGEKSAAARAHKDWSEIGHALFTRDLIDAPNTIAGEMIFRKIIQIEQAVRRNPKQPDYEGLDIITANMVDESGAVYTRKFTGWVGEQQRAEAFIMKNSRQYHEEKTAAAKKQIEPPGGANKK